MNKISSREIRGKFLEFFQRKEHMLISDSSIVPKNDPTLLFINSGMAPLKKFFTGEENPPSPRLCDVQPCIRTIDIDEIGDKHHLTSFQMLGSWSINDYFKEKAIKLAYEFLTKDLGIHNEKLYVTIFAGDDELGLNPDEEARKYWIEAGIDENHIVACGKEDNFWGPTSETGPCGPCTEVFYDTGVGEEYKLGKEFDTKKRYIEIWNAGVFMQLNKNADGTYSKLSFTSVDTGAGLERLSMVLNDCKSVYETDLLCPIKDKIYSKIHSGNISERDVLIMTDHLRTSVLILSEKVKPSNEGRGYIPRKLIRKCILIINKYKIENFDFEDVIEFILDSYCDMYPNFIKNKDYILNEFKNEYNQFSKVLKGGLERLEQIKLNSKSISGDEAFELVTTFGLPIDIIKEFCNENSLSLDELEYKEKLRKHKEISRNSNKDNSENVLLEQSLLNNYGSTLFCGYDNSKIEGKVLGIIKEKANSESANSGEKVSLILDKTCMYAESGGQCSDKGYIYNDTFKMRVDEIKKTKNGVFIHIGEIKSGKITLGENVISEFDLERRTNSSNSHTAVHLLQSALRSLFGNELHQAGSKIDECKLRFDFNYDKPLLESDIFKIEELVNKYIRNNVKISIEEKDINKAISEGAIALFDSKYGEKVRVVSVDNISKELCGGTHTSMTGNIGLFVITSTEGIGKGIKRISALTGKEAINYIHQQRHIVNEVSSLLKVKNENIIEKLQKQSIKATDSNKKDNESINKSDIVYVEPKNGVNFAYITCKNSYKSINDDVINIADAIKGVILCICSGEKKRIIIASSIETKDKFKSNEIINYMMERLEGKGGGSPRLASGGTNKNESEIINVFKNLSEM